jgi:hypothetical protein
MILIGVPCDILVRSYKGKYMDATAKGGLVGFLEIRRIIRSRSEEYIF